MIKPMLAYKVDKKPVDWSENVFIQPKLDGVRCVIQLDENNEVVAHSRTGKEFFNVAHIKNSLHYFFTQNPDGVLKNLVFGHLNKYQWYLLERKHLNHHFEQFNLLD